MKKIITITVMAIFLLLINTVSVKAADEDFNYVTKDGYAIVTGYTGAGGDIVIPDVLGGCPVQVIGEAAFYKNKTITKVKMPDTVVMIDEAAFMYCGGLNEIYISKRLQVLQQGAFGDCISLEEITLPATLSLVGAYCFDECSSLRSIMVDKKGQEGFFSRDGVLFYNGLFVGEPQVMLIAYPGNKPEEEYVVPDYVTYIRSFSALQNLQKLVIPSSVTDMGLNAISRTEKVIDIVLKHVDVPNIVNGRAFNSLAPGSRIICKNEAVRAAAESSIYLCDAKAILATEAELIPATGLQLTSPASIVINSGESTSVSWKQIPANTTENVTWTSTDSTGLQIESNGKVTAKYRGAYTLTGTDESGHSIKVAVTVPTRVADVEFEIRDSSLENVVDATKLIAGEYYQIYARLDLEKMGTNTEKDGLKNYKSVWTTTKKCSIEPVRDEYRTIIDFEFIPEEPGAQTLHFAYKDKAGVVVAEGEMQIHVAPKVEVIDITKYQATLEKDSYVYTGKEIKPVIQGGSLLTLGTNYYTVSYKENIEPGTGFVCITGRNGAEGVLNIPFTITKANKGEATLSGTTSYRKTYGDKAFSLNMKANAGQKLLYSSSQTKVVSVDQAGKVTIKGAGKAVITVKAAENSAWKEVVKQVSIQVDKASLDKAAVAKIFDQMYTGKEIRPSLTVTYAGKRLKAGVDYKVSYQNNKKTGKATATLTGIGNYTKSKKVSFQIKTVVQPTSFTQITKGKTGTSVIQLSWKRVTKASGYEIYRSSSKNGKYQKVAAITKGSTAAYTDKRLKSGTVYYYKIRAYRKISGKNVIGAWSKVLSAATEPVKPSLLVKGKSKAAVLSWKPVKGASGYEIYQSKSKNGTYQKVKTLTKGTIRTYTQQKLVGKKTYYYKIRAYKSVGGKKIYGDFSAVRVVKVR